MSAPVTISLIRGSLYLDCGSLVNKSTITNSSIYTSTINMNGGVITNLGVPVNLTDSVNKQYVDDLVSGVNTIYITLTNTVYTTVSSFTSGTATLDVKNVVSGGPSATFNISKNDQTRFANPTRLTSQAGNTTNEKLEIDWSPNGPLRIKKTGTNYDGQYKIILNIVQ